MPDISVVILTMGDRPEALARAISSVHRQNDVDAEIVLVINGGDPDRTGVDAVIEPGGNVGIPAGRNVGAAASSAPVVLFLDDDGELLGDDLLVEISAAFLAREDLGVVALRIVDERGESSRRHHPSLRLNFDRSTDVTSFPGGASAVRTEAFVAVGGLCEQFFYGLEETDLAWRLIERGWVVRYCADLRMRHPRTTPSRHVGFYRLTARNRVWLARQNLPHPMAALYVINWTILTAIRARLSPPALKAHLTGLREGFQSSPRQRAPMSWRTVWRLTRLGRPPVI